MPKSVGRDALQQRVAHSAAQPLATPNHHAHTHHRRHHRHTNRDHTHTHRHRHTRLPAHPPRRCRMAVRSELELKQWLECALIAVPVLPFAPVPPYPLPHLAPAVSSCAQPTAPWVAARGQGNRSADLCVTARVQLMTSTLFWSISRVLVSPPLPHSCHVLCSPSCPCGLGADWCLGSDVVTNF